MNDNNDNQWTPRWTNQVRLSHNKHDYIMLTDANYEDEEGFDNGESNPYWVGQFQSVKLANGRFKSWRAGDSNSTLSIRLDEEDNRVSYPKNRFFFNAIHFDIYQKQPVKDAKGNIKVFGGGPNKGQQIMGWKVVEGIRDRKALARNPDENTAFFRKTYLEVGPAHYENLLTILDKAKELCHCGGHLDVVNYTCSNCGSDLLDMDNSDLSIADLNRFGESKHRCNNCSHRDFPVPVVECDSCEDPTPHRFDQVIAKVKKVGSGPQTVIQVDDVMSAAIFELDNKEPIVALDDSGEPIIENGEFLYTEDIETVMNVQWNFDEGNPVPSNGQVSTFLGLQPGDAGYSAEQVGYSSGRKKSTTSRRRFR